MVREVIDHFCFVRAISRIPKFFLVVLFDVVTVVVLHYYSVACVVKQIWELSGYRKLWINAFGYFILAKSWFVGLTRCIHCLFRQYVLAIRKFEILPSFGFFDIWPGVERAYVFGHPIWKLLRVVVIAFDFDGEHVVVVFELDRR